VAEDNIINQALMRAQLEIIGYKADYAVNGLEALKYWREGKYDMLLTDINMPKMDGYELTRTIRLEEMGCEKSWSSLLSLLTQWKATSKNVLTRV
jgi:CheY-like chemotaxis protein